MDINTSYGPPAREVYEQQQAAQRAQAHGKGEDCAACGPHSDEAVIIDEKLAKVLELAHQNKGGGDVVITAEDLEKLKTSGALSDELKIAADQLIADLKAAEAEAAAGASSGAAETFGFTEEVFNKIKALLENLLKQTGKDDLSLADVEAYVKSGELNEEDKAALEKLIARLREDEAEHEAGAGAEAGTQDITGA